jgi:hypothetical protein
MIIDSGVVTGSLEIQGPLTVTGSITATQGITGSLLGTATTASYVLNAVSSSFSTTASYAANVPVTSSYALTASYVENAQTASYVVNALTASFVQNAISSSLAATASYVVNALTASYVTNALSASLAATASTADNFTVRGTLTAQTIVAQTITSSVDFVTGSTRFGSSLTNTHQFTGSVGITGSLDVNNFKVVTADQTSSMSVLSSSFALTASYAANVPVTASYALTASYVENALTASYVVNALTASYVENALTASYVTNAISASLAATASYVTNAISASLAATASLATNVIGAANRILFNSNANTTATSNNLTWEDSTNLMTLGSATGVAGTISKIALYTSSFGGYGFGVSPSQLDYVSDGSHVFYRNGITPTELVRIANNGNVSISGSLDVTNSGVTGSLLGTASFALTASYVVNALTASYVENAISASQAANSYTASFVALAQSASYVDTARTASYVVNALTASFVANAVSSSYALTASFALNGGGGGGVGFPFSGSAVITGSLNVSGSGITGSFFGDGSGITGIVAGGKLFTQSSPSATWTFNHLLNYQYPNVTVYNASNEVIVPQSITATDVNTLTLTFGSPVSGYAIANIGSPTTVTGKTARQYFTTANTWSFDHALGDRYVMVQAFDDNFEMVIPTSIILSTTASATILFDSASSGYALATIGGDLPTISASYAGYVLTVDSVSPYSASWAPISSVPTASYVLNAESASFAVTASYVANAQTASYVVNALTASYVQNAISASQAANSYTASYVLNAQTASFAFTASYISGSGAGSGFPFSGSGVITGSLLVSGTFIVSGTVDFANANIDNSRYLHSQTSAANTWSVNHNLEYSYPNVTIYDSTGYVIQPDEIISVDNNTTSVLFNVAQAGYANVSVGGISTGQADRFLFTQTSATGSWVINHGLNYKYVNVDIYDNNDQLMIPQVVTATDVNTLTIEFATATSGNAIISKGGARTTSLFVDRSNGNYSFSGSMNVTGSGIFSGDVDADNFNTTSDFRLKTNLEIVEGALDKIEALNGYTFDWITEYSGDKTKQIGLVAQEVYAVQPELISYREFNQEEIMVLDYSKVTALLVNAVKELSAKVKDLESKINN